MSPEKCRVIVSECMGLTKEQSCLIVTDNNKTEIAKAMFDAAAEITPKTTLLLTKVGKVDGQEPGEYVAQQMKRYDVVLLATTRSLTHTQARRKASDKGARIASMPNITKAMIERCISIDYGKMHRFGAKIAARLAKASSVRVESANGTKLDMSIKGVRIDISDGIFTDAKAYGNLPDGEVCMMPIHGTAKGEFVIDGSILDSMVDRPIKVMVSKGYARQITGGKSAEKLKRLLKSQGRQAYNIAELGIGINPKALVTGSVLEDEKALGTVHIAFGNNVSFGGDINVPLHVDGIILKPTLYAEGKMLIKDGKFVL